MGGGGGEEGGRGYRVFMLGPSDDVSRNFKSHLS